MSKITNINLTILFITKNVVIIGNCFPLPSRFLTNPLETRSDKLLMVKLVFALSITLLPLIIGHFAKEILDMVSEIEKKCDVNRG